jgi:hypothetical protein
MDEKTEELRDIFMTVSDEETVTETQAETRGSLVGTDDEDVADQLRTVVDRLRAHAAFDTDLATETYVALVRAFYEGATDAETAERLDLDPSTVFRARLDLHLVGDADTDAPFDVSVLRRRREADDATLSTELGVDADTVAHYRRVVAAQDAARAANHRFQREFDELLTDADLSGQFTDGVHEDGLEEAAEDIETDVSF